MISDDEIVEGDFVITKIDSKTTRRPSQLFIARVEVIDNDGYEGVFLRKVRSQLGFEKSTFIIDESDGGSFSKADVMRKLPASQYLRQSAKGKSAQCSMLI